MKILGIDFGRKKIGLARGDSDIGFAEPVMVIRRENDEKTLQKINEIAAIENIEEIVLGISEGEMGKETIVFGEKLIQKIRLPVKYFDETLSTHEAQTLSIEAGINRKKRKRLEDAYAASIMLQNYLTSLNLS